MTQARRNLISLSDTPYYHCINRAVRGAYLCGEDRRTGRNYEHRKQWIVDRIKTLSAVFSIDVCAYAIMGTHFHVVLHVDEKRTLDWSDEQVVARWKRLFRGVLLVDRYMDGQGSSEAEGARAREMIGQWRERLADISWYMRCLNEHIAREANREDGCRGRFWEGRFKSQALLDERALLACMAYVDLNPIRAGMADTPEGSDFTSIQERIRQVATDRNRERAVEAPSPAGDSDAVDTVARDGESAESDSDSPKAPLMTFTGISETGESGLPYRFRDYLELVDWTGRAVRADKRGFIPEDVPPILGRLGMDEANWIETVRNYRYHFFGFVGTEQLLSQCGQAMGRSWLRGVGACRRLLGDKKGGAQATA